MNKTAKRIGCLLLSACITLPLFSCGGDTSKQYANNPEGRPLVFATEKLDGNFNPFFATSGGDSSILSQTQIGMLTTDEKGNLVCGENEPTVALSFKETEIENTEGKKDEYGNTVIDYTEYEFVIKNNILFSDGTPLTIKDVLFNLYVYLDPAYMGSSTMYSTDIVGLTAYRTQNPQAQDENAIDFYGQAIQRQKSLIDYLEKLGVNDQVSETWKADVDLLATMFYDEIKSDWNASAISEDYKRDFGFTEDWQVFYEREQVIRKWTSNGQTVKDVDGKYITNITPAGVKYRLKDPHSGEYGEELTYDGSYENKYIVQEINEAKDADSKWMAPYKDATNATQAEKEYFAMRDFAINKVYEDNTATWKDYAEIIKFWATGANWLDKVAANASTKYYEDLFAEKGDMPVKFISGITTDTTTVNGVPHKVLKIKINGVDPKAKYNFSFAVAPLHYYSGKYTGSDGEEIDYVATANPDDHKYGVKFYDSGFFEQVLQADHKNNKPVGAGVYQVSTEKGATGESVSGNDFYSNGWVYFARNDNFHTVGSGLNNAKIKYLHYKETNSDMVLESLKAENIDVGEPNATSANVNQIGTGDGAHLAYKNPPSNGYGYVGINPKYVPDLEVRQAIMKALDPDKCIDYYTEANAKVLYRSMSEESWIWDEEGIVMPSSRIDSLTLTSDQNEIKRLVEKADWVYDASEGLYKKDGKYLEYTFTIAGSTDDHPATKMFELAAEFLNDYCGFKITVATDISALKKLATGQLAVWAAAWNSTIDPDMYQVYHKDSKATSVNNWGYPTILGDRDTFSREYNIIVNQLSPLIMKARKTNDPTARAEMYVQALDYVQQLAVELPTYQRNDLIVYNKNLIDPTTINNNPSAFAGVFDRIWEVDYL